MSPAIIPGLKYTAVDVTIAVSIIGGLGMILIFISWYLGRQRPLARPASTRNRDRPEEDRNRKTEIFPQDSPSVEIIPLKNKRSD
jgi:hypothetical protein